MRTLYFTNLLVAVMVLVTVCLASPVHAAQSSIVNSFSITSDSGGNSAEGGTIVEGTSRSSVDITTTINGETVTDIHETSEGGTLIVETTTEAHNGLASTTTSISTTGGRGTVESESMLFSEEEVYDRPVIHTTTTEAAIAVAATSSIITNTDESIEAREEVAVEPPNTFTRIVNVVSHAFAYVISLLFT